MSFFPKVSIIIPIYNGSDYMREAIDSALAQTYKNIEIVVVNDGSRDEGRTREVALSYGDKIRYFEKENGGVATALNLAIEKMTGEYFSWLSHDDVYYPHKVETQINFLDQQENKEILIYSDFDVINKKSKIIRQTVLRNLPPEKVLYELPKGSFIHGCTLLIPKKCFDTAGCFNPEYLTTQDYYLWVRMALRYPFLHVPQKLIQSREHSEQGTITMSDIHLKEVNAFYIWFLSVLPAENISLIYKIPAFRYYFGLFVNYKKRRLFLASKKALEYAISSAKKEKRYVFYFLLKLRSFL